MCSYYNSCFFKKYSDIRLHDSDLQHDLIKEKKIDAHMFFFPFLCSGIPELALGILKLPIRVCFLGALQPAVYYFFSGMI